MTRVRRPLLDLLWTLVLCCGAVGTTLLNPRAAALVFAGLALALYAGRGAIRALAGALNGPPADAGKRVLGKRGVRCE